MPAAASAKRAADARHQRAGVGPREKVRKVIRTRRTIPMVLTDRDNAMLSGAHGAAAALAMSILVRMAEVYGAASLMDITQAHIDSTIYLGDATLEFAERLA